MKRVVVISDFHCGHEFGLTPPAFSPKADYDEAMKEHGYRMTLWDWYAQTIGNLRPIDYLIVNGDCVSGPNKKWGSRQTIVVDRNIQVDMAVACIAEAKARNIYMTYGTPYHTGEWEDAEYSIAQDVGARKIGAQDTLTVDGVVFNYRHHIGSSQAPYSRHTAIARERIWNLLWAEKGQIKADVVIRSHVHYFGFVGGEGWIAFTTPALQGLGDYYGSRMVSGTVDFGLLSFDVRDGVFGWRPHLLDGKTLLRRSV
jgi:hypothetical protein